MALTKDYGISLYKIFKDEARQCLNKGNLENAIVFIRSAAWINYNFFLTYSDEELEYYLQQISLSIHKQTKFVTRPNAISFVNVFSKDTQGLSIQYVEAIISAGFDLLYIYENDLQEDSLLFSILSHAPKVKLLRLPNTIKGFEKAQWIYDSIIEYGTSRLLMQLLPDSASECIALYALPPEISRFQINLTDHAFWLGCGCFDYTLEFRQRGCSISTMYRGFHKDQILLLPFYPVINDVPFSGFPHQAEGAVKIFSGGASYKIMDTDDTFLRMCNEILKQNTNAVILFATKDFSGAIKKRIKQLKIDNNFILLPFREDIASCFRNIDIYLNTFPYGGGLMCQYAAQNAIPILNYVNTEIEECVNQKNSVRFTSNTKESFYQEAYKLCQDKDYRQRKGKELHDCVISHSDFNLFFKIAISQHKTPCNISFDSFDFKLNQEAKIKALNSTDEFKVNLIRRLGLKNSLRFIPCIFLEEISYFIKAKFQYYFKAIS